MSYYSLSQQDVILFMIPCSIRKKPTIFTLTSVFHMMYTYQVLQYHTYYSKYAIRGAIIAFFPFDKTYDGVYMLRSVLNRISYRSTAVPQCRSFYGMTLTQSI